MPSSYFVDQIAFYGAYHSTFGNQIIHGIFVPILLITGISMGLYIPYLGQKLFDQPTILTDYNDNFPINVPLFYVFSFMYPLTYLYIDIISGLSWIPMAIFSWFSANYIIHYFDNQYGNALPTIIFIHIFAWIMQFIGHGLIEGRKPALMDSLYQSIVLAPLFVWCEFFLFPLGYAKEYTSELNEKIKEYQNKADGIHIKKID